MALRLKWKGIKEVSPKGKEVIERTLKHRGEIALAVHYIPRKTAQKIAAINNLSLDYVTMNYKEKPTEHYVFRIDSQGILRRELTRSQRLRFWRNLTIASIVVFLFSLLVQIVFWK